MCAKTEIRPRDIVTWYGSADPIVAAIVPYGLRGQVIDVIEAGAVIGVRWNDGRTTMPELGRDHVELACRFGGWYHDPSCWSETEPDNHCAQCGCTVYDGMTDGEELYCDDCAKDHPEADCGFRTCEYCGQPMTEGMTNLEDLYTHEGNCFEAVMDTYYANGWRENDHEGAPCWDGGYYDYRDESGKWWDTGVFYTDWQC